MEFSRDADVPLEELSVAAINEAEASSLSSPRNSPQEELNETEPQRQQEEPPLAGQSAANVLSPSPVSSNKNISNRVNSFHSLYNYFSDASFDDSYEDGYDYYGNEEEKDMSSDDDDDYDDDNHNAAPISPMTESRNTDSSSMNSNDEPSIIIGGLPAQLHPAVSRGMNRVASCYFSVRSATPYNSASDLQSLLGLQEEQESKPAPSRSGTNSASFIAERNNESYIDGSIAKNDLPSKNQQQQQSASSVRFNASDILYHDIMMNVFTYLDAQALASFSQTAHRPNFEVFYFLQLQLQRALLVTHSTTAKIPNSYTCNDDENDPLGGTIAGSGCIARLATMDKEAAQRIVQEYLDSNSTLKTMPLSHSLAYVRHLLQKHRFGHHEHDNGIGDDNGNGQEHRHSATAAATTASSAALVVALVGVSASVMQAGTTGETIITTSIPNAILGMGLAGSVLKAGVSAGNAAVAARRTNTDDDGAPPEGTNKYTANNNIKIASQQVARMMQALPFSLNRLQNQNDSISDNGEKIERDVNGENEKEMNSSSYLATGTPRNPRDKRSRTGRSSLDTYHEPIGIINDQFEKSIDHDDDTEVQAFAMQHPMTPNPYEHLPQLSEKSQNQHSKHSQTPSTNTINKQSKTQKRKMPSGCVGAYLRAVQKATYKVTELIKQRRRENFDSLQEDEKLRISATFLDACNSNATLPIVKEMLQVQSIIDADGFYIASDTMETCALHTAAFHGASEVVEFLIKGIGEHSPNNDGGLCNVDLCDLNGWSALHFAAGANSVETVRVLANHGAKLALEASNGYTPFHWAQRLSNKQVAEELQRLGADVRFIEGRWQPLSLIANRFFSMIPSQ